LESVRISATISAEDNESLEAIIERTGLKKSTIIALMIKGIERDIKDSENSAGIRFIEAWGSKFLKGLF
jgi:hypothetical protein